MDTYVANDTYARLTLALAAIEPCPFSGKREPDQMVKALMAAEIWPASVEPGETAARLRKRYSRRDRQPVGNKGDLLMSVIDGWLADAPPTVIEAFADWREGRLTWAELRERIDKLGEVDPAIKSYRDAKLSPLDRSN